MSDFSEVSLGFAEFVSQLLEETFDATLSAQHHQMEQYAALLQSLDMSSEDFYNEYFDGDTADKPGKDEQEALVDERKSLIEMMMQKSEMPKLVVESGEIRAKLELSNIYQDPAGLSHEVSREPFKRASGKATDGGGSSRRRRLNSPRRIIQKLQNMKKNKTAILIDKNSIQKSLTIPGLRMAVTPASKGSSESLYSEVIIKFKMV